MDEERVASPDISVIVAAYNVGRYIRRALESALDQAGPSVEVIMIDDNSTDDTWVKASEIRDARLRLLRLPANAGPGAARNAGIALARGKWIAILDGDDAFLPGRLARCMAQAVEARADIVVDNLTVCREADGAVFPMFSPSRLARSPLLSLARFIKGNQSFMGGYALGYLKPVFSAGFLRAHALSYRTDIRIGEDYLLLAKALACGARCVVEPREGYLYTARSGSTSHRLTPADINRIADCDRIFLESASLDPAAARAQRLRNFHLREAYAFALLVDAIKKRDLRNILDALAAAPLAARHLWRPAWVRLRRTADSFSNPQRKIYDSR